MVLYTDISFRTGRSFLQQIYTYGMRIVSVARGILFRNFITDFITIIIIN